MARTTAQPVSVQAALASLTPLRREFIEWMLNPTEHIGRGRHAKDIVRYRTQAEWARAHGLNPSTLKGWKKEPKFRAAWEAAAMQKSLDPERVGMLVDFMFDRAINHGDRNCAVQLMSFISKWTPRSFIELRHLENLSFLTDDQLAALVEIEKHGTQSHSEHDPDSGDGPDGTAPPEG